MSIKTLRCDGIFLALAGSLAMTMETVGHFGGVGPLAAQFGSPHTIGGFEAHGLAVMLGLLLYRAAGLPERRMWHWLGLTIHVFLGLANLVFWSSFVELNVVPVGVVTTILHAAVVALHSVCLSSPTKEIHNELREV
jgi:hypothetical protein